jgi:hypothetical protein
MTTETDRKFRLPLVASSTPANVLIIDGTRSVLRALQLRLGGAIIRDRSLYSLILSPSLEQICRQEDYWLCEPYGLRLWFDKKRFLHVSTSKEEWITLLQRWGGKELT